MHRQRHPHAPLRAPAIGARVEEEDASAPLLPILTDPVALAPQGSQGRSQGAMASLQHTGPALSPAFLPLVGATPHTGPPRWQAALLLRLAPLGGDQVGVRRLARGLRSAACACAWHDLAGMVALKQRREVTAAPSAAGIGMRRQARAHVRSPPTVARLSRHAGATRLHSHWRPSARSAGRAPSGLAGWAGGRVMQGHLSSRGPGGLDRARHRAAVLAWACCAALWSPPRRVAAVTSSPQQSPARSTVTRSIWRAIRPCSSGVRSATHTVARVEEQHLSHCVQGTLRHGWRDGADVPLRPTMGQGASGVGARLAPVARFPHTPILPLRRSCAHPIVGLASLFSKYERVGTLP